MFWLPELCVEWVDFPPLLKFASSLLQGSLPWLGNPQIVILHVKKDILSRPTVSLISIVNTAKELLQQ